MINTNQVQALVVKLCQFQANALRSINGVLLGIDLSKDFLASGANISNLHELNSIRRLLSETADCLNSFMIVLTPNAADTKVKIVYREHKIKDCSEKELIYQITSFEREVVLCFERLKIASPKHTDLCDSAQETIINIVKEFMENS